MEPSSPAPQPSETIVRRVAKEEGVDAHTLPPLFGVVEPEALDRIVGSGGATSTNDLSIRFRYCGYRVLVKGDGTVRIVEGPENPD